MKMRMGIKMSPLHRIFNRCCLVHFRLFALVYSHNKCTERQKAHMYQFSMVKVFNEMLMMLKSEGITHKIKNVNFNIVVVVLCDIEINTDATVATWGWHSLILIPYLQCSYMCIMWIVREYGKQKYNTFEKKNLQKAHQSFLPTDD